MVEFQETVKRWNLKAVAESYDFQIRQAAGKAADEGDVLALEEVLLVVFFPSCHAC